MPFGMVLALACGVILLASALVKVAFKRRLVLDTRRILASRDAQSTGLTRAQDAAASCERAELWVHTNTTRRSVADHPASHPCCPGWLAGNAAARTSGSSKRNCT